MLGSQAIDVIVVNFCSTFSRRTPGGRKLWESKDDRKWGHDKFEEMTQQDRHYEEVKHSLFPLYLVSCSYRYVFSYSLFLLDIFIVSLQI